MLSVVTTNIIYICSYFGSKRRLLKELTLLIPKDCKSMYEVCGGLGAFILNRYWWFDRAVYNEFNEKVYNLVAVLKDPVTRDRFIREVSEIPMDKDLFDKALLQYNNNFPDIQDKAEQAKIVFMLLTQSMNCEKKNWVKKIWSKNKSVNIKRRLEKVAKALEYITIQNGDCFEIIKDNKDNTDAWILADVPYPEDTERVSKNSYDNEKFDWPLTIHQNFVEMVKDIDGKHGCKILICNYESPTYDKLVEETKHWHKMQVKRLPSPAGRSSKKRSKKIEYVYLNYDNYSDLAKYSVIM
ncbi:DNA adenine methylase [Clostridium sp. WILCCON 0269]|uniref:DNA adenine methylase n=1 Tax=Candidatus Clostridium eludens TaxID=3381663 RepID=A0ABW8SER4_9CLOT